jgi:tripartite-type tricarboxylate transporter receptor subunit TctC
MIARAAVALAAAATAFAASAQQYPAKPVRAVVAFAAGGFADTVGRLVSQKIAERLGQPIVVENRGGAGGNIGARAVAQSTPDGYTLLVHTAAFAINPSLYKDPGYAVDEFAAVSNMGSAPGIFAVNASHAATTLREFIQSSKGKRVTYATAGVGTSSHLGGDYILRIVGGLDAVHVPFQGGAPALTALVSNQVDIISLTMTPVVGFIKGGKLRGLALSSLSRVEALPDVPTVGQAGLGEFEERSWVGFFAPAKTPGDVVNRLNGEVNQALKLADVRERFTALGLDAHPGTAAQFSEYVRGEVAKWAKVAKATGITLE